MRVIIDRFEGDYAIVELPDGTFADMPKVLLEDASEQDVIEILVDRDETAKRKLNIDTMIKNMFID